MQLTYTLWQRKQEYRLADSRMVAGLDSDEIPIVRHEEYQRAYQGELEARDERAALDEIYYRFNADHPADFRGRSFSVGDIVCLNGQLCYMCQPLGWATVTFAEVV